MQGEGRQLSKAVDGETVWVCRMAGMAGTNCLLELESWARVAEGTGWGWRYWRTVGASSFLLHTILILTQWLRQGLSTAILTLYLGAG